MRRLLTLTLIVLLSGCFGADSPADTPGETPGQGPGKPASGDGAASIPRPAWAVGDWWTYRDDGGTDRTWVVTEAGAGYTVDIDEPELAFVDAALLDISTIGPVSAALDGMQDDVLVKFFDWPITANKTWDLTWDAIDFAASATVSDAGAAMEAVGTDGRFRTYTYDIASKWFGSIVSIDANGTTEWSMELVDFGSEYAGTYARYTLHDPLRTEIFGEGRSGVGHEFNVPAGATDIWTDASFACDPAQPAGQLTYQLVPPGANQEGPFYHQRCPGSSFQETRVVAAHEGVWREAWSSSGVVGHVWIVPRTLVVATL